MKSLEKKLIPDHKFNAFPEHLPVDNVVLQTLLSMGFDQGEAILSLKHNNNDIERALDELNLSIKQQQPKVYLPSKITSASIDALVASGFDLSVAQAALDLCEHDVDQAMAYLGMMGVSPPAPAPPPVVAPALPVPKPKFKPKFVPSADLIAQFEFMGFSQQASIQALTDHDNDCENALNQLIAEATLASKCAPTPQQVSPSHRSDASYAPSPIPSPTNAAPSRTPTTTTPPSPPPRTTTTPTTTDTDNTTNHSSKRADQVSAPEHAFVFHCNDATKLECMKRGLFGTNDARSYQSVKSGDALLLFNYTTLTFEGVFQATCDITQNLVPEAWGGRFPWQCTYAPFPGQAQGSTTRATLNDIFGKGNIKVQRVTKEQLGTIIPRLR